MCKLRRLKFYGCHWHLPHRLDIWCPLWALQNFCWLCRMNYYKLTIDWNNEKGYVDISMTEYVIRALIRFQHPAPSNHNMLRTDGQFLSMANKLNLFTFIPPHQLRTNLKFVLFNLSLEPSCTMTILLTQPCLWLSMELLVNSLYRLDACKILMDYAHTYPNTNNIKAIWFFTANQMLHTLSFQMSKAVLYLITS